MIQFKADCGHTIQAEDKQAGRIVKCAYCGREVEVPHPKPSEPDLLLREVDLSELAKGEGTVAGRRAITIEGHQRLGKGPPEEDDGSTQKTLLRTLMIMGYVTVGLVVCIFVVRAVISFSSQPNGKSTPTLVQNTPPAVDLNALPQATGQNAGTPDPTGSSVSSTSGSSLTPSPRSPDRSPPPAPTLGRINQSFPSDSSGIFVEVFSESAKVYVRPDSSDNNETLGADESENNSPGLRPLLLAPGKYRIAVAMDLTDSALSNLPGFSELREALEFERDARAARKFFARDLSATTDFIDEVDVPQRIVRYYDVEVSAGQWQVVCALFVPGQSIQDILSHLPAVELYRFNQDEVRQQLNYDQITDDQQSAIVTLLSRTGQAVYQKPDQTFKVYEIDPQAGSFRNREIRIEASNDDSANDEMSPEENRKTPSRTSPWGRGRQADADGGSSPEAADLASAIENLKSRQQSSNSTEANEWKIYLYNEEKHALWKSADIRTRVAFVDLMNQSTAQSLIAELGETLLHDPDFDVRLAIVKAFIRANTRDAIKYIDSRLKVLEKDEDEKNTEQAKQEIKGLKEAKKKLGKAESAGPKKTPWGRG